MTQKRGRYKVKILEENTSDLRWKFLRRIRTRHTKIEAA